MAEEVHMILAGQLQRWNVGRRDTNDRPVLVVEMADGTQIAVEMPVSAAEQMGDALLRECRLSVIAQRRLN